MCTETVHFITLFPVHADMWEEVCRTLDIQVTRIGNTVRTVCSVEDRETAWQLLNEEFERLVND